MALRRFLLVAVALVAGVCATAATAGVPVPLALVPSRPRSGEVNRAKTK